MTESEEQSRLISARESLRNSLLAALSHDLRTPLTVLFGQAEILTLDLASSGHRTPRRPMKFANTCSIHHATGQ
ncbi:histidine kinase dimerization/phospho-acceptor domain-containing protein [Escherichia coli]